MHLSHTPQYIIQTRNVLISILKGALWDIGQVRCGICEFGLFPFRKFLFFPFIVIVSHFIVILPPSIYSVKKYKKSYKIFLSFMVASDVYRPIIPNTTTFTKYTVLLSGLQKFEIRGDQRPACGRLIYPYHETENPELYNWNIHLEPNRKE